MFKNTELEKLVEDIQIIEPSTYLPWVRADRMRLDMLTGAIATGNVKFHMITPNNCACVPPNTLVEEVQYAVEHDDDGIPDNFHTKDDPTPCFQTIQDGDAASRFHIIRKYLELGQFMIDGPSFRRWFEGFCRPTYYQPDVKKEPVMFDIIQRCSNSLYPNGRDGDFDYQDEQKRIEEWLEFNFMDLGRSTYYDYLVTAINPARSPKSKKSPKNTWDFRTFESFCEANGDRLGKKP